MDPITNPVWLIKRSIYLDIRVFLLRRWSKSQKIEFLIKKYYLLFKHKTYLFELGRSKTHLFGNELFYGTKYGLSDYQSMITRLENLMDLAGIKNPAVVFDVGANVGFFSTLILEKYRKTNLYAFEPVPQVYECLEKNVRHFKNAKLYKLALSAVNTPVKMNFDPGNTLISNVSESGNVTVDTTTLDEFCTKNSISSIDLLKIDVEGFEHEVLMGAQSTLKNVKYLMLEVTLEDNQNYTISRLFSLLYSEEFDFQLVAFRNYADKAEGAITLMDTIFINRKFISY